MIRFKTLSIRNFLSFGNIPTIINLERNCAVLVLGEDLDNTERGTGANGTGKTAIINALVFSVYDKPLSDISKDNLVNNINKKNMVVAVEFVKEGKTYTIERGRKTKAGAAGNYVLVQEDGKDITPDSINNANALIEKIIDIPYELFVRIVTFSATHIPFLDLPVRSHYAANQTDIIEQLFDLKILSEKANKLKELIKQTEQKFEQLKSHTELLEREHTRHKKQLESAKVRVENWYVQNKTEKEEIEQKLTRIKHVDIERQRVLHDQHNKTMSVLAQSINERNTLERKIKDLTKNKQQRETELIHLSNAKCPYCLQKYKDANKKISECEQTINEIDTNIQTLKEKLNSLDGSIIQIELKRKEIKQALTVSDIGELLEIKGKSSSYKQQLKELQVMTNPFIEPLEELKSVKLDTIHKDELNVLEYTLKHQDFLLKLLTKKDSFVRKILLHKYIPFLNQRLQLYLTGLGLSHLVEFTHEMTAEISQFRRPLEFGNLSNGQRARVNLALSFAFRDVLQTLHQQINICILDEVLDVGLDSVGVAEAARMLKHKARDEHLSLFIISHREEMEGAAFGQTVIVQLSKGFSYLKESQ